MIDLMRPIDPTESIRLTDPIHLSVPPLGGSRMISAPSDTKFVALASSIDPVSYIPETAVGNGNVARIGRFPGSDHLVADIIRAL